MEFKKALTRLEESDKFKGWRGKNKEDYLSYAFCELGSGAGEWQIGYHNEKEGKATTFIFDNGVKVVPDQEVFKKPGTKIGKIELDDIKLSFAEIVDKAKAFQKEKYPREIVNKTISILQNLEGLGTVWNITFITSSFNTLNIKLSAKDGKILVHKLSSILDLNR